MHLWLFIDFNVFPVNTMWLQGQLLHNHDVSRNFLIIFNGKSYVGKIVFIPTFKADRFGGGRFRH